MRYISREHMMRIKRRLTKLYGNEALDLMPRLEQLLGRYGLDVADVNSKPKYWDENEVVMITYADSVQSEDELPLETLNRFMIKYLKGSIRTVHILPFCPWTSDDGFSVVDYREVDQRYGDWEQVEALGKNFSLMFDLVLNHCSSESRWFKDFVTGVAPARWYFLPMDTEIDLSAVVRPRPWPLLTEFTTKEGVQHLWTTFSDDQVDLNWQNPDLLFEFLDILFLYLSKGCRIFRLDAVAFLWKEIGTNCLHLDETHEVVKLFRDILELVAPSAVILTETNVPHEENISYFGKGDEAHMVYNFTLPPLLLHSLLKQDCSPLRNWAKTLPELKEDQTFFNFSSSHDGIGVRPLQGILSEAELNEIVDKVKERGGAVSMKANSDGSESPYELNITYRDALKVVGDEELSLARFLLSQALVLSFRGVPAVYIHSLLGTPNDLYGMEKLGYNRAINRKKWHYKELVEHLKDKEDPQSRIFGRYQSWIRRRSNHPAFHPNAKMEIIDLGSKIFGFLRISPDENERILCLFNFTESLEVIPLPENLNMIKSKAKLRDILNAKEVSVSAKRTIKLKPYNAYWLALP